MHSASDIPHNISSKAVNYEIREAHALRGLLGARRRERERCESPSQTASLAEHVRIKNFVIHNSKEGFTLIELLVVIAIVAILALVTILVINPAEFLKQARDVTRISDLRTVNTALGYVQVDNPALSLGTASTTYVSIADPVATSSAGTQCQGLSLPALPSGWNYHCAASSTLTNVDGTGWIPVNFTGLSFASPFSKLPIDPTNTSSSHLYYTYTPGGSWELTSAMEASRNTRGGEQDKSSSDGGAHDGLYEIGTDLALAQTDYGDSSLVGYWRLDNASTTALDASWNRNHGTGQGGITIGGVANQQGTANGATSFDGGDDYVDAGDPAISDFGSNNFTVSAWAKLNVAFVNWQGEVFGKWNTGAAPGSNEWSFGFGGNIQEDHKPMIALESGNTIYSILSPTQADIGQWYLLAGIREGNTLSLYVNGAFVTSTNIGSGAVNNVGRNLWFGKFDDIYYTNANISDVRIYNRALSATEISNLYNATKP